jgi:plastocyanin
VLTRASRILLCSLTVVLLSLRQESFAQTDSRALRSKETSLAQERGKISGRVIAVGKYQNPKPLPVFKNRSFCGPRLPNETLLVGRDGGLRNAVVTLHPIDRSAGVRPLQVALDNKRCAFAPHVQVAGVGSELVLKNSDPILHTVHARLGNETLFNVGLPNWRQVTKRLERIGIVKIDCDVLHTWMSAVIVVTDTPYFAVSDQNGNFLMDKLPAGRYRADIWHEKLGTQTIKLALDEDKSTSLEVVYSLNGKFR